MPTTTHLLLQRAIDMTRLAVLLSLATLASACTADDSPLDDPEVGMGEGVDFDADNPNAPLDDGKSDLPRYKSRRICRCSSRRRSSSRSTASAFTSSVAQPVGW